MSEYDVAKVRAHFPALDSGLAFFDGPGGSQTPDVVADAVRETLVGPLSNRGDLTLATDAEDVDHTDHHYRGQWFDDLAVYWREFARPCDVNRQATLTRGFSRPANFG